MTISNIEKSEGMKISELPEAVQEHLNKLVSAFGDLLTGLKSYKKEAVEWERRYNERHREHMELERQFKTKEEQQAHRLSQSLTELETIHTQILDQRKNMTRMESEIRELRDKLDETKKINTKLQKELDGARGKIGEVKKILA